MNRQVIKFEPNSPVTVALEFPDGVNVQGFGGPQVKFSLAGLRVLYADPELAQAIRTLQVKPGEPFTITKRTATGRKPWWDLERVQTAGAHLHPQHPVENPASDLRTSKTGILVTPRPGDIARIPPQVASPQAPPVSGTGTDGPAPQPRMTLARVPAKIPLNVAFREILGFINQELDAHGEQWDSGSKQAAVCTLLIQAGKCGWVSPWERAAL